MVKRKAVYKSIPRKRIKAGVANYLSAAGRRRALRRAITLGNIRTAGLLGVEKKFLDTNATGGVVATIAGSAIDPAAGSLCCPTQGDTAQTRDGRRIVVKTVQVRGVLRSTAVLQDQDDMPSSRVVRVIVFVDTQTNGAAPTITDMLTGNYPEDAFINLEHGQRFRILFDRTYTLHPRSFNDGAATGSVIFENRSVDMFKSIDLPITFDASNGNIGDITDNSIHVCAIANETGITLEYNSRCRFVG